jgi:hypothetical protein
MSLKTLLILVPVLSLAALSGCKASCTGLCDEGKDQHCHSSSDKNLFNHAECYAGCQREKDMEDDGVDDCKTEFDSLLDCMGQQSNICDVYLPTGEAYDDGSPKFDKCSGTQHDYSVCVGNYCTKHQSRDYCSFAAVPASN